MTTLDEYLPRIQAMHSNLVIQSMRLVTVGAHNNAVMLTSSDGNWVFRFAKNDSGKSALSRELCVLDAIKGRTAVAVPVPVMREPDAIAYRMLMGEPLTYWTIAALNDVVQQRIADQLGSFLRELHNTPFGLPIPDNTHENKNETLGQFYDPIKEKLYPYLEAHQCAWIDRLFADADGLYDNLSPEQRSRLIYNDFKIGHVLYDPVSQNLSGILDFGIACYDVPDIDICNLMQCFGESFVTRMFKTYPEASQMLPRARYGVWVMELLALLEGILEKNPYKLCVPIGIPRDIRFPILQ